MSETSTPTPTPTPNFAHRLLPTVLDELAVADPERELYVVPKKGGEGFQSVNARRLKGAVDRAAWILEQGFGKGKGKGKEGWETVGYIGPNDLAYFILILASNKAGYKMLFSQPGNSLAGHDNLIKATDCTRWLIPPNTSIDHILAINSSMTTASIPDIHTLLDSAPVPIYEYTKTFEEARDEPFVVIHTSSSTGLPKPIFLTHAAMRSIDAMNLPTPSSSLVEIQGEEQKLIIPSWKGQKILFGLPLYHSGSIFAALGSNLFLGLKVVLLHHSRLLTVEDVKMAICGTELELVVLPPPTLRAVAADQEALEMMGRLKGVCYTGGPLPQEVGDLVSKYTTVISAFGTSEAGMYPVLTVPRSLWKWYSFHPQSGFHFRPYSENLSELIIVRSLTLSLHQPIFEIFPDLNEYGTSDLWSPHPSLPNLWNYEGRADDTIVFVDGCKWNPLVSEALIERCGLVRNALVVGNGRRRPSLLIELQSPLAEGRDEELKGVLEAVWEYVKEANEKSFYRGRVDKEMIVVATADKPFLRAGKGTVQRALTIKLYEKEIDDVYRKAEASSGI